MSNIYKDLGLNVKGQKYRFVEADANIEEDPDALPLEAEETSNEKIDTLKELMTKDMMFTEKEEADMKKSLKQIAKASIQDKKQAKNDITTRKTKIEENSKAYQNLKKDVSKYQEEVIRQNEADILDFRGAQNSTTNFSTVKAILNNDKSMTDFEKQINKVLVDNKYDTDENILAKEQKDLMDSINPELIQKRYEELKRMRTLLFQKEIRNKHQNRIKSKLYHKIKKKQKLKQEAELLEQLQEIDPDAVKDYLEKQREKRIDERISLKHSINKFNQTVKRYNLQHDGNIKESLLENYRKRDQLMERVKNPNEEDEDSDDYESSEEENENDKNVEEVEDYSNASIDEEIQDEGFDPSQILINFNAEKKNEQPKKEDKENKGVFGMSFMKNAQDINSQVKSLLMDEITKKKSNANKQEKPATIENNIKSNKSIFDDTNKRVNKLVLAGNKDKKLNLKSEEKMTTSKAQKTQDNEDDEEDEKHTDNKITSSFMNDLKNEENSKSKSNVELNLNEDEMNKIIKDENIKDQEEFLKSFVVENSNVSNYI